MGKILYGLAALAFAIAILTISDAPVGSRRALEGGYLVLLTPVFLAAGFLVSRIFSKKCPKCAERVKKEAAVCKHCGAEF